MAANLKAEIVIGAKDNASKTIKNVDKSVKSLDKSTSKATKTGAGITSMLGDWRVQAALGAAAIGKITQSLGKLYARGKDVDDLRQGFERLGGTEEALASITGGLVNKFEGMQLYNLGAELGLTAEQFKLVFKSADYLDDTIGGGLVPTVKTLLSAIGTGRTTTLARFGIDIASSSDKAQNLTNILGALEGKVGNLEEGFQSNNDSVLQAKAAWVDFYDMVALTISRNSEMGVVLKYWTSLFKELTKSMTVGVMFSQLDDAKKRLVDVNKEIEGTVKFLESWGTRTEGILAKQANERIKGLRGERRELYETIRLLNKFGDSHTEVTAKAAKGVKALSKEFSGLKASMTVGEVDVVGSNSREAVAQREREMLVDDAAFKRALAYETNQMRFAEQQRANAESESEQKRHQQLMIQWESAFASMFSGTWASMWQEIAAGSGFQTILKMFLDMIGNMSIQLGTMIMLAAIAGNAIPWLGWATGPAGVAAGLALQAFGGIVKGLSSGMGGGSSASSGGSTYGSGYSGNSTTAPPAGDTGSTIIINIEGGLSTSDEIARAVVEQYNHGKSMGYN